MPEHNPPSTETPTTTRSPGLGKVETLAAVWLAALAATALIGALSGLAALAGAALAQEPAAEPADTEGTIQPAAVTGGATEGAEGAAAQEPQRMRLRRSGVTPRIVRFAGKRRARYRFEIAGKRKRNIRIQVVHRAGDGSKTVIKKWDRNKVAPGEVHEVRWAAKRPNGNPAPNGEYFFRIRERGGKYADASKAKGNHRFRAYSHIFPVRGPHTYGDGIGAGRGHRGQDVFAKCGTKLVAARAGRVKHKAYQGSAAGHYVVISGLKTDRDYAYMHLRGKAKVREGQRVQAGELIGRVGRSGNATGCHLHFELWTGPGWYTGGTHSRNVTKALRRWDRWG